MMAFISESSASWPEGVYQIETTDPVLGGVPNDQTGAGTVNRPLKHLADRTAWQKAKIDELLGKVIAASLDNAGLVRLSSLINSGAENLAATPKAVKNLNDAFTDRLKSMGLHAETAPVSLFSLPEAQTKSGFYSWTNADAAAPPIGAGGPIIKATRSVGGDVAGLIALGTSGSAGQNTARVAARVTSGSPGDWGAWAEMWMGQQTASNISTATRTFYQKLPSGIIVQGGIFNATTGNVAADDGSYISPVLEVFWPIAFPNACILIVPGGTSDPGGTGMRATTWSHKRSPGSGVFSASCLNANKTLTGSYLSIGY